MQRKTDQVTSPREASLRSQSTANPGTRCWTGWAEQRANTTGWRRWMARSEVFRLVGLSAHVRIARSRRIRREHERFLRLGGHVHRRPSPLHAGSQLRPIPSESASVAPEIRPKEEETRNRLRAVAPHPALSPLWRHSAESVSSGTQLSRRRGAGTGTIRNGTMNRCADLSAAGVWTRCRPVSPTRERAPRTSASRCLASAPRTSMGSARELKAKTPSTPPSHSLENGATLQIRPCPGGTSALLAPNSWSQDGKALPSRAYPPARSGQGGVERRLSSAAAPGRSARRPRSPDQPPPPAPRR